MNPSPVNNNIRGVEFMRYSVSQESEQADVRLPGYVDYMLIVLNSVHRVPLLVVLAMVALVSLVGNVATIVVNVRRPMRPFYRICLLSLASTDLISTIFQSTSYVAQLTSIYPPVWTLGSFLCGAVPFLTTWAVLVNSFVLVAIALDRYVAVGKMWRMPHGWEPSSTWCAALAAVAWLAGAAVAGPMVQRYHYVDVFIIETNPANRTEQIDVQLAHMCLGDKVPNLVYFASVFGFIYLPLVLVFLTMNGVIALEIWRRRRPIRALLGTYESGNIRTMTADNAASSAVDSARVGEENRSSSGKRTTETCTNSADGSGCRNAPAAPNQPHRLSTVQRLRSTREIRQLRMFRAILCIMMTFLVCRLPSWIYLLYKLQNEANQTVHWVLNYALGSLSLISCALNPLLYTFLAETIGVTFSVADRLRNWFCGGGDDDDSALAPVKRDAPVVPIRPTQFYFSEDRKEKLARI